MALRCLVEVRQTGHIAHRSVFPYRKALPRGATEGREEPNRWRISLLREHASAVVGRPMARFGVEIEAHSDPNDGASGRLPAGGGWPSSSGIRICQGAARTDG